jgi:asparagine synthase (glutamine-hydrolysing)
MCGIAFLWAPAVSIEERRERMDAALQQLKHRGPDESACFVGSDFVAGHTRLAIIDLKGGHQPMRDPSGRWVLVFNGEIYNYRELRTQLAGRWNFRDDSDTEVLLAGLVTEGPGFVERLDGMWAFVLHDVSSGDSLLSRDRFGKKPLYYRRQGAAFACASELPALATLTPDVAVTEDAAGIADYFRYGYALPGATCIAGVKEVLPAHTLRLRTDGSMDQWRYWAPSVGPWKGSFEEAAEHVRELLTQSVRRRQLASDVEVGAFLSGGVDSTTVCALAQESGFGRLRTFTAGFAEPTYDERAPAARAAAELGTLHTAEEIKPDMAAALARELPRRMGQPFGDSSLVPSALVASVAAQHVKVVLTGDGSDEIFGGYARYMGRLIRQRYHQLPASLRSIVERGVLATPEPYAHHSGSLLKRAHLFVRLAREDRDAYIGPPAIRKETLAQLAPGLGAGNAMPDRPWLDDPDELRQMLLMDCQVYLPQDILQKVDRATMMYSVEARSPFLDKELFEFVIRLPWQWHFSRMRGKRLLHAAMRGRVPDFIWNRRKQGFASPVSHWLRHWLGDDLLAMTNSADTGVVDPAGLRELLREHRAGRADHSQPLWLSYAYLRWRAD